ncbi:MAG: aminodeoxychorismate synthase component I [Syntrophales bacterium]
MVNIILHDQDLGQWLQFSNPLAVLKAETLSAVVPLLAEVDNFVERKGFFAAGWIGYEASAAFDSALHTHPATAFPLACFGIFKHPPIIRKMPAAGSAYPLEGWRPSVSQEQYAQAIARIREHIAAGDTYQVNYTLRLWSKFHEDPWNFFLNACGDARYGAFIEAPPYYICSASPELFFSLKGKRIFSKPMKGTAPRGRTTAEDSENSLFLHNSEKNRAENVMIVDMIRNDIGKIAEFGSVDVPRLYEIEKYPTVLQMTSTVEAVTAASLSEIMKALFPCASITGAPKAKTMEIIAALETAPRNIYTGTIGYYGPGRRALFNVAIRTTLIDTATGRAEYGVGGGIVWDSTTDDEYEECLTKARVILDPISPVPFSLLETLLWTPAEGFFLQSRHVERLKDAAEYFIYPFAERQILENLHAAVSGLSSGEYRVRLLLAQDGKIECQTVTLEKPATCGSVRVQLAKEPVSSRNPFLFHKTTRREVYEQAKNSFPDADDVILWNEKSEITESCIANVVILKEGRLVTPPVSCGLLNGVYRAQLLAEDKITEEIISINDMKNAKQIFLINSVRKWREAVLLP